MPLTTYTAGQVLTASSLNANFSFAASGAPMAVFNETQASNTAGGGSTSGSFIKRVLNTTVANTITGCSLASSVITLPAGTYYVFATAPCYESRRGVIRLQNTTDATTVATSQSGFFDIGQQGDQNLMAYFTITGNKNFEIQYQVQFSVATNGLGVAMNFAGSSEIYTQITITKVA